MPSSAPQPQAGSKTPIAQGRQAALAKSKFERHVKQGDFLFLEGDSGTEMFIIKKGKVKILKEEGSKMVELVTLGPGSVLGEMSLLDNAPRSASAQAVEPLYVTAIDQNHLNATLAKVPSWLNNVIKIVVQRLRDTTSRNYRDILQSGLVALLKALLEVHKNGAVSDANGTFVPEEKVREICYSIFGLSSADVQKLLKGLELLSLLTRQKNKQGKSYIKITDIELIQIYYDFLRKKWKGLTPVSEESSDEAKLLANYILEAGKTRGTRRNDLTVLDIKQIQLHLEQLGEDTNINEEKLDELKKLDLVKMDAVATKTKNSTYQRSLILYDPQVIGKFVKECDWMDIFSKDINDVFD